MFKVAECNTVDGGKTFTEGSVVQVKAMLCTFYAIYALHCSYNKFQIQVGTLKCILDVPHPLLISFPFFSTQDILIPTPLRLLIIGKSFQIRHTF